MLFFLTILDSLLICFASLSAEKYSVIESLKLLMHLTKFCIMSDKCMFQAFKIEVTCFEMHAFPGSSVITFPTGVVTLGSIFSLFHFVMLSLTIK